MSDNRRFITLMIILVGIVLVAALIITWISNNDDDVIDETNETLSQVDVSDDDQESPMLDKIVDNPAAYYGQKVTVSGEIQDIYNQRVFKLSDQIIGDELLVVTQNPLTERQMEEGEEFFQDNANVTATGEIRQLVIADLETELNFDFPESIEVEYTNKPVLVAESFTFSNSGDIFDFNLIE